MESFRLEFFQTSAERACELYDTLHIPYHLYHISNTGTIHVLVRWSTRAAAAILVWKKKPRTYQIFKAVRKTAHTNDTWSTSQISVCVYATSVRWVEDHNVQTEPFILQLRWLFHNVEGTLHLELMKAALQRGCGRLLTLIVFILSLGGEKNMH